VALAQMPARAREDHAGDAFWASWDEFFAALRRARGRAAREHGGLTLSQYRLLCAVEQAPLAGLRELGEQVGSSGPTLTRMLAALERDGVIERLPHPHGNRRRQVRLTARGRQLLADKGAVIEAKRTAVFDSLSPAERAQVQLVMARLAQALEAL
jgi:DNA-binding MarR family transcriptional regulator